MISPKEIARILDIVEGEIRISNTSLWLDPHRKKELAYISHAHSDHAGKSRHRHVIVSANGLALYRHRTSNELARGLPFGKTFSLRDIRLTLLPAGHILGSAQILIEREGLTLLYSGDFKLRPSATAEPIEIRHADILVVESTYAQPHYQFPPHDVVLAQLKRFLDVTTAQRRTPLLLAYALGKAQETIRIVNDLGYEPWVHDQIYTIAQIYEQQGVQLGPYYPFTPEGWAAPRRSYTPPRVVIFPPYLRESWYLQALGPNRTALLSGFAIDTHRPFNFRADVQIPLSDHADFYDWLEYIRRVAPKIVITTHGSNEAPQHLAKAGFHALSLNEIS